MLFNAFIDNTDDHLRNHAFPFDRQWFLSPAFDLVPQLKRDHVVRAGGGVALDADPRAAFSSHVEFGLSREDARTIFDQIAEGARRWREMLDRHAVNARDRETLARWAPAISGRV